MCTLLNCTPTELGQARRRNSNDVAFLEMSYLHRKQEEAKAYEKAKRESKAKRR